MGQWGQLDEIKPFNGKAVLLLMLISTFFNMTYKYFNETGN